MTGPPVVLRGDNGQPLRAACPDCDLDVDVTWPKRVGWADGAHLDAHDIQPGRQCAGSYTPIR